MVLVDMRNGLNANYIMQGFRESAYNRRGIMNQYTPIMLCKLHLLELVKKANVV